MTNSNHITFDEIRQMPIGEIAALSAEQLTLLQDEAGEALRRVKTACDWLDGAIALKYADKAQATRQTDGKDTGTIRFDDGPVTVIADLPKRVDWDQEKLAALIERIRAEGDDAAECLTSAPTEQISEIV